MPAEAAQWHELEGEDAEFVAAFAVTGVGIKPLLDWLGTRGPEVLRPVLPLALREAVPAQLNDAAFALAVGVDDDLNPLLAIDDQRGIDPLTTERRRGRID